MLVHINDFWVKCLRLEYFCTVLSAATIDAMISVTN